MSSGTASGTGGGNVPGTGGSGPPILVDAATPSGDAGGGCSADLQSVVGSNGQLVPCPADQGCVGGACVPACRAAQQSKANFGCDFWAPDPPFLANDKPDAPARGPCYAVFVANTWGRSAKISVERNGQSFDVSTFARIPRGVLPNVTYESLPADGLPPNEVAILFLSHREGASNFDHPLTCPVTPAVIGDAAISGSGSGRAFRVMSDTPVTAYDILPYGGANTYLPSASLLFPTSAVGTNYLVVGADGTSDPPRGEAWLLVTGTADGTKLTVASPGGLRGGTGLAAVPAGQMGTFDLSAGQMLQWIGGPPPTGTILEATQPILVTAGSTNLFRSSPTSQSSCGDAQHLHLMHIKAYGSEYAGAGIMTRQRSTAPESIPYRLVGVVDQTTLSWDPLPAGAPITLNAGQTVDFLSDRTFGVRSQDAQHPFGLTQFMPGSPVMASDGCSMGQPLDECILGDTDWINVFPTAQFLERYVFFTDPTYATTNVVVTRTKGPNGFADVSLDCLPQPISGWQDVGTQGKYQVAYIDLVRATKAIGSCGSSRHEIKSSRPFAVAVWGTDFCASYGYPAGGNLATINEVVLPPIVR
jgi:hypothetical protein